MPFISTIRANYNQDKVKEDIPFEKKFKITGGNVVYTAGGYRIHMFTDVGAHDFKVEYTPKYRAHLDTIGMYPATTTAVLPAVEYLVIAGGGSGGNSASTNGNGGGGAGGYQTGTLTNVATAAVSIGGGGSPVSPSSNARNQGSPSVFGPITSIGGGGGGSYNGGLPGQPGGSGGGNGGNPNPSAGSGTPGQGNPGTTSGWYTWTGTGGGGAGSVSSSNPGFFSDGGRGLSSSISGTAVTRAGGGGGGGNSSEQSGDGFDGGGKGYGTSPRYGYTTFPSAYNPSNNSTGQPPGMPNTGGGGGAGSYWSPNAGWSGSGQGGSGLVIVRYPFPIV